MPDLTLYCTITLPAGGTLDLNAQGSFKLEASSFGERAVQHRKVEATNPYVEGSYTVSSVKENVTEQLAVYVYGSQAGQVRDRVKQLCDALDQIQYTLVFGEGGYYETWTCQPADYNIKSSGPLRVAKMALVTAQVPRRPTAVFS